MPEINLKIGNLIQWYSQASKNNKKGVIYKITSSAIFITTVTGVKEVIVKDFIAFKKVVKLN